MSFRHLRHRLALLGAAAAFVPLSSMSAHSADTFKALNLATGNLSGTRAVSALGKDLARVADHYGMTADGLRKVLLSDKTLRVARDGRLIYVEDSRQVPRGRAAEDPILNGVLLPLEQTFSLHSKPGASRYLILNFQGKTITNTAWNASVPPRPAINATPFTLDGDPKNFNDAERTLIQQVWQRVAEDFAPFDVDVTTDIGIADRVPATSYATAVITRQADYGVNAPGIAFIASFGNPRYEPAFVAYDTLYRNPKYIAECISHEFGHRLGLTHDGTGTTEYYTGQGIAPMQWAPIMGSSYKANISQFSKGEYRDANNTQDDFAVMSRYLAFRPDSAGSSSATAAAFTATSNNGVSEGSVAGTIELQGDSDLYAIAAAAGSLTASVTPAAMGPDANLTLALVNDAGQVLASSTPSTSLKGSISFKLPRAGTYYLRVGTTGYGTPSTTGFSDYGSRGLYRLSARYPSAAGTPPAATVEAKPASGVAPLTVAFSAKATGGSGTMAGYAWNFSNKTASALIAPSATYAQPGTYTAELKVTDSAGFSTATSTQIIVGKAFTAKALTIARTSNPDGSVSATVKVNDFTDDAGKRIVPSTVYGAWSGSVVDTQKTGYSAQGSSFSSASVASPAACFTFTLNRADTADGGVWFTRTPQSVTSCPQQAAR